MNVEKTTIKKVKNEWVVTMLVLTPKRQLLPGTGRSPDKEKAIEEAYAAAERLSATTPEPA